MKTEQQLLQQARQFNQHALAEIYDRFSPELYRYTYRLLGDADQAEDCVAETFSRFLHALQRGGGPRKHLRAYLYRVAHNWVTDQYRRAGPPPLPLDANLPIIGGSNPAEAISQKWEQERVRDALRLLTPVQRQVILLKFLEGWTNEEVAQALDKPTGAVKSLQHRGLAALRRILLKQEEPPNENTSV